MSINRFQRSRRAVFGRVELVGCSRVFHVVQRPVWLVPAVPLNLGIRSD